MKVKGFRLTGLRSATAVALLAAPLAACSSLGGTGPSASSIRAVDGQRYAGSGIGVVDLDEQAVRRAANYTRSQSLAEAFGASLPVGPLLGRGHVVDAPVGQAPPAGRF